MSVDGLLDPLELVTADERDLKAAEQLAVVAAKLKQELGRVIIGQDEVLKQILIALLSKGHCLLEGVPGLAKALMISSFADLLSLRFSRIQFTPDRMTSDMTGTEILDVEEVTGRRRMRFVQGPLFANIVLADEINRAPPKTQAALLQAMQESKVTTAGQDLPLEPPFLVLGTQNPIEQEGTYPLPEAQLDRFMFHINVGYPTYDEEVLIAEATTGAGLPTLSPLLEKKAILGLQKVVRRILITRSVTEYAVQLARGTRPESDESPEFVKRYLSWGAGPRASQAMLVGAKAHALLDGRVQVSTEDISYVAHPVLRHRLVTNFTAKSDRIKIDDIISMLIEAVSSR